MNRTAADAATRKIRVILPVILRITFSLVLWTLGAATMTILEKQQGEHRVAPEIPSIESGYEFH